MTFNSCSKSDNMVQPAPPLFQKVSYLVLAREYEAYRPNGIVRFPGAKGRLEFCSRLAKFPSASGAARHSDLTCRARYNNRGSANQIFSPFYEICKKYGVETKFYPFIAAASAGKLVLAGNKLKLLEPKIGLAILLFHIAAGSKTVPYPLPSPP